LSEIASEEQFLGHPRGLAVCFMTELWERFAYYGMFSLLILYLTKQYAVSDVVGNKIVAAYGALVWMLPVFGGFIADRYLGSRKAVTLGALLMAFGFLTIAFPVLIGGGVDTTAPPDMAIMFLSMAIIISGVGFLKANISTVVGALYQVEDPRRDSGFTLFYMGINVGGALGPIVCGGLGHALGMRYGFAAAGVGMIIGLATFLWGQRYLGERTDPPYPERLKSSVFAGIRQEWLIYALVPLLIAFLWQALKLYTLVAGGLLWFSVLLGLLILYYSVFHCQSIERDRMIVVSILIVFAVLFWSLYMQMFGSLVLFSDRLVDREVLGTEIAAAQLNGLPSILVISLAPLMGMLWFALGRRKRNPSIPAKFAFSLILIGLSFTMPACGRYFSSVADQISLFWFLMVFVLMVVGELCQAPIAMNMVTRLCPKRVVGMMMGAFFVSLAVGSIIAGELAARYTVVEQNADGSLADPAAALTTYATAFANFGMVSIVVGGVLLLGSPLLARRMHESQDSAG